MTDAPFPDRWLSDKRIQRLSDSHFRAFVTSLSWAASNRTDGVIEPEDVALISISRRGRRRSLWRSGSGRPTLARAGDGRSLTSRRPRPRPRNSGRRSRSGPESARRRPANAPLTKVMRTAQAVPTRLSRGHPGGRPAGLCRQGKDRQGHARRRCVGRWLQALSN